MVRKGGEHQIETELVAGDPRIALAMAQRAQAAQHLLALGEMTGGIAHDFRNLLATIDSGVRLMEQSAGQPEKLQHYGAAIREGITRGLELVNRLLSFANHEKMEISARDVGQLLIDFQPFLRYAAGPRVHVALKTASPLPPCLLDAAFFEAAVLNLVVNARDSMPDGGEIRISTDRQVVAEAIGSEGAPRTFVRVRIEDNGRGMSEELLRKVLRPFFSTKGDAGTGLGLPQVQSFMRLVGGRLVISSRPRTGTQCDLLFPTIGLSEGTTTQMSEEARPGVEPRSPAWPLRQDDGRASEFN